MNKRINELMDQSYEKRIDTFSHEEYNAFSREKFAKLIIRECIGIVEPSNYHQAFPDSHIAGHEGVELLEGTVARIKEHFGIVE